MIWKKSIGNWSLVINRINKLTVANEQAAAMRGKSVRKVVESNENDNETRR